MSFIEENKWAQPTNFLFEIKIYHIPYKLA